ncbi:protein BLISTER [Cocos nucifera]|nr:protein BLISTER [Cocos nucifera]
MASAQVLPNSAASSRKGHLEAGKKRLEEFRRQKAAKKAAFTGQLQSADVDQYGKHPPNSEHVRDGATSGRDDIVVTNPSGSATAPESKTVNSSQITGVGSSYGTLATSSTWLSGDHKLHSGSAQERVSDEASKLYGSLGFSQLANGYYDHFGENNELPHTKSEPTDIIIADQLINSDSVYTKPNIDGNINHSSFHYSDNAQSGGNRNPSGTYMHDPDASDAHHTSTHPEKSESISALNRLGFPSTSADTSGVRKDSTRGVEQPFRGGSMYHDSALGINRGEKISDAISRHLSVVGSAPWHASEPSSGDSSSAFRSFSNQNPFPSSGYGSTVGRSRPSFLDSLGVPRVSSLSHMPYGEPEKANQPASFNNSKFDSAETLISSPHQQLSAEHSTVEQSYNPRTLGVNIEKKPSLTSVSMNDVQLLNQGVEDHDIQRAYNIPTLKKDEDFAALEQHIEDLTQEKFSLQRALDTSRALAESLAAENSSLTESYNQQGKVISQLKSEMGGLQEEIKAQLLALESVKMEYANAQLECNAADERAKILASEVISLEEKALRLRSNELKLEKQSENLNSEITSYKHKVSILEKERQDFQSTIDALQAEKKLLQSKLRKASSHGKVKDTRKTSPTGSDPSTSTEDLGVEHVNLVERETSVSETMLSSSLNAFQDVRPFMSVPEDGGLNIPDGSGNIPVDQLRMVENINSLISELALEKEELVRALKIESSNCSKLKDANKDLSQKLEAQTQRLELMTAQQMANENVLTRPADSQIMHATKYADEGDEVVERVLGWMMKLFPGGPAKRRTSKLL